jgi:glycosyltransferase involved in cell wall biosynthesis
LAKLPPGAAGLILAAFYMKAMTRGMPPRDLGRWTRRNEVLSNVLAGADDVIFPSRATWEAIRPRFSHDRCRIIPYGLSSEWFAAPRTRAVGAKPPEELVIGYAGALMPHKGPHVLLEAVRRLGWEKTTIRLAGPEGDSAYVAGLRETARGLNVEFLGPVSAVGMPAFLRSLDLLAMTSVWPENLPFVVLEAQAGGVPVVASRLAGVADQVGDERLLFEPGSAEGLAAALARARDGLAEIRLGKVSTAEEMTAATEAVYSSALAGH